MPRKLSDRESMIYRNVGVLQRGMALLNLIIPFVIICIFMSENGEHQKRTSSRMKRWTWLLQVGSAISFKLSHRPIVVFQECFCRKTCSDKLLNMQTVSETLSFYLQVQYLLKHQGWRRRVSKIFSAFFSTIAHVSALGVLWQSEVPDA